MQNTINKVTGTKQYTTFIGKTGQMDVHNANRHKATALAVRGTPTRVEHTNHGTRLSPMTKISGEKIHALPAITQHLK